MKVLRRSLLYFRPFWRQTLAGLALMMLTNALSVMRPWPLAILLDQVFGSHSGAKVARGLSDFCATLPAQHLLAWTAASVLALQLTWGLFQFWHTWILVKIGLKSLLVLRTELYSHLQRLSLKFHDARRSGDSTFRVTYDTQSIQTIYNRGFMTVTGSLFSLAMMFLVMWSCSWKLTLVSLIIVPLLMWVIYYFADRIRRESTQVQQEESDVLSRAQEGLTSIRIVQAFGRQHHEIDRFAQECEQSLSANLRLTFTNVASSFAVGLITALGTACLFYLGGQQAMNGEITLGTFVLFTSYLVMLYQPLEQLSYTGWAIAGATAGMQRVFEILDTPDDVPDTPSAVPAPMLKGRISFDGVSFGYDANRPVLNALSVEIEPGSTVAFVGGTGAGKSTLLSLVPRFYDPSSGTVKIDGHDIRSFTKQSLRQHISIVLQDTLLLSTTAHENIAYGKSGASEAEIIAAAKAARAHDFIMQMPHGYHTQVGERGVCLSGGQRQRIGIARAFLKNTPILLLDEPTSALDVETEAEIMEAIDRLMKGRTTLIVTHRLTTIHHVDKIHVLQMGKIYESGSGPELVARNGLYADLWEKMNQPPDDSPQ